MFLLIASLAGPRFDVSCATGSISLQVGTSGTGRHAPATVNGSAPETRRRRARPVLAVVAMLVLAGCVPIPHPEIPRVAEDRRGLAVFDIDGTLTPRVSSIFSTRPDAAAVARFYADRGYRVVYLTGADPHTARQSALVSALTRLPRRRSRRAADARRGGRA